MKAVLSPFRKKDKYHKKQQAPPPPPAPANDDDDDNLEWEAPQPTKTAWEQIPANRFPRTFGSKNGGRFRVFKKRLPPAPEIVVSLTDDTAVESLSPDFSIKGDSKKSFNMNGPSERSSDLENRLNPPPQRRRSSGVIASTFLPSKPFTAY